MTDKTDGNHTPAPPTGKLTLKTHDAGVMQRKWKPAKKHFVVDEKVGTDWSYEFKKFVEFHRIIDKENDRYYERIVDPDTGDVIREVDEPLSTHQGHGSAKTLEDG